MSRLFYWLGMRDSNPRMPGPEPGALPLGESPRNEEKENKFSFSEWRRGLFCEAKSSPRNRSFSSIRRRGLFCEAKSSPTPSFYHTMPIIGKISTLCVRAFIILWMAIFTDMEAMASGGQQRLGHLHTHGLSIQLLVVCTHKEMMDVEMVSPYAVLYV